LVGAVALLPPIVTAAAPDTLLSAFDVATMVARPAALAGTAPVLSTEATFALDELQMTVRSVAPASAVTVAIKLTVSPAWLRSTA